MTEIRKHESKFSQESIDEAISKIPEGKTGAIVIYADADAFKMNFGVVAKTDSGWTFAGTLEKEYKGPWSAHAQVAYSW